MKLTKTYYSLLILLFISLGQVLAQDKNIRFSKENFSKDVLKKVVAPNLKMGNYHFINENYALSAEYFQRLYEINPNNSRLNYYLGICYLKTYPKEEAFKYFQLCYELDSIVAPDLHYQMALAEYYKGEFDDALSELESYKNLNISDFEEKEKEHSLYSSLKNASVYTATTQENTTEQIDSANSIANDTYPVYMPRSNKLIFSSDRNYLLKKRADTMDYFQYSDVFVLDLDSANASPKIFHPKLTKLSGITIIGVLQDESALILRNENRNNGDIGLFHLIGNKNGNFDYFDSPINTEYTEVFASFTTNLDTLYFCSDRTEDSKGGFDVFYAVKDSLGIFNNPVNVSDINTTKDEIAVWLSEKGKKIYFSSNSSYSMGGFDIFFAQNQGQNKWSKSLSLGHPFNTIYDDLNISFSNDKNGYVSTYKPNNKGGYDIFSFEITVTVEEIVEYNKEVQTIIDDPEIVIYEKEKVEIIDIAENIDTIPNEMPDTTALIAEKVIESDTSISPKIISYTIKVNVVDVGSRPANVSSKSEDIQFTLPAEDISIIEVKVYD